MINTEDEKRAKTLSQLIENIWEQYGKEMEHLVPLLKMPKPGEPCFKQTKEEK